MLDTMDPTERAKFMSRYLLGEVSQEERDTLEDQYLANDDLFEELVAAENDLIDSYVKGRLSRDEQQQFEGYFLNSPERRERVDFAKSLASYGAAPGPSRRGIVAFLSTQPVAMRFAAAAMFVAVAGGILWMMITNSRIRSELEQSRREQQQLRQEVTDLNARLQAGSQNQELAQVDPPGSARLSLVLAPVARGNSRQNTIFISPGISTVAFRLNRPREDSLTYGIALETVEGSQILQKQGLKSQPAEGGSKVITAEFLSKDLPPGDYVLKLQGTTASGKTEELDAYSFRVLQQ